MVFVKGTTEFTAATARITSAIREDFPREFKQEVAKELEHVSDNVRQSALGVLPRRGGLAAVISASGLNVREITKGARLTGSSKHDIGAINRGRLRHPLFGNRNHWFTQHVHPGWWSTPIDASKPALRDAAQRGLENTKRKAGG